MNVLRKLLSKTIVSPSSSGDPGTPPKPAHCITTTETYYPIQYVTMPDGSVGTIYGSSYPVSTTTCYPATPGTPPIPATPATVVTQFNLGWAGGARSVESLTGDGTAQFSVSASSVGAVVGLDSGELEFSRTGAEHALYFRHGLVSVIEGGVEKTTIASFVTTDVFRIRRVGSGVRYFQNDTLLYTSRTPSYGAQYLEASMYSGGDEVLNASLVNDSIRGIGYAALAPLASFGSEGVYAGGDAALLPLASTGTGTVTVPHEGAASFAPMQAIGGNAPYAMGEAVLQPLQALTGAALPAISQDLYGYGDASLQPMAAVGGNTEYSFGTAEFSPLESSSAGTMWQGGIATLEPIQAVGGRQGYAFGAATIGPLQSTAESGTAPSYALGVASLGPLQSFGYGIMPIIGRQDVGTMAPLASFGADRPYAGGEAVFQPLQATSTFITRLSSWADITAPDCAVEGYGGANAIIEAQAVMYGAGHDSTGERAADIVAPGYTLDAWGGANASITASSTMEASGTAQGWGRAALTADAVVEGSGTVTSLGYASLSATSSLIGYGGAVCSITLSGDSQTIEATGTSGSVGHAAIVCPLYELEASGTVHNYGYADIIAPDTRIGGQGQAWIISPGYELSAIGSATVVATYEAYSINLKHAGGDQAPVDEVTRYTNFPFTHVVRFRGSYFGAAADGLYLLEGTTDDGQAIPYAVKTCASDFGAPELKNVASAYLSGRLGPLTVSLHAGEDGTQAYEFDTLRGPLARNHREKFGRGVKNRYFALGLSGEDALELDSIELEINKTSRRI